MTIEMKIKDIIQKYWALYDRYSQNSVLSKRLLKEIDRYEIMELEGYTIVYELDGKECFR